MASTTGSADSSSSLDQTVSLLITASHILHHNAVLDAYGHLSARHPTNPSTFLMPRNLAPALVSKGFDIVEYNVSDGEPVYPETAPKGYAERYIHSEIYRRWEGVSAVVHSHDKEMVPWSLLKSKTGGEGKDGGSSLWQGFAGTKETSKAEKQESKGLRAISHMAGFLGTGVPIWDIAGDYARKAEKEPDLIRNMLVLDTDLGNSLAAALGPSSSESATSSNPHDDLADTTSASKFPTHRLVLMRGHGYTAVAEDVQRVVFEAIFAQANAKMQTQALMMSNAMGVEYQCLSTEEAAGAWTFNVRTVERPWGLWVQEVRDSGKYRNEMER